VTIFQFALIRSLRKKANLAALCAVPLAMIFIRPLWTLENYMGFSFYSLTIMFAAFSLVRSIMTERVTGTVVRIYAAPVTTFRYLSQNLIAFCLLLGVQIVILVAAGTVMYHWEIGTAALLIVCYIVFAVTCITFSLAWYSLFRSREMSDAVFSIVISFMAMLGGIFIPIPLLPELLRKIGMLFPTYWLSNALLSIQLREFGMDYWLSVIIMLLFSAAFLLYGSRRRME